MKIDFSRREQRTILLAGGLAMIILWAYSAAIFGPLKREADRLGQEVRTARERLKGLEIATSNEAALREQHQQLNQTVESLRKLLPAEQEVPAVIERLSNLASQSGLKIQAISPLRPIDPSAQKSGAGSRPIVYREIPIQIDALAGYHQLGTFLSLVESGDKPMQVSSLQISQNPREVKRHNIKLLLHSYFAVKDDATKL